MIELDFFINSRMKVLLIISDHYIKTENNSFCPLNQQEIANLVPCSKLKVNQILKELIEEGYVQMLRSKGRYALSKKSINIINKVM